MWQRASRCAFRHERRLCQEVALHLAYRWSCKLDLDNRVPHPSTFSVNRLGRFWESEILRHIFERAVATYMTAGLVKGEGFAVDASVMEAMPACVYRNLIRVDDALETPKLRE